MLKLGRVLCVLALVLLVVPPAFGQEQEGRGRGRGRGGPGGWSPFRLPSSVSLTDDQKAKVAEIEKTFGDKWKAAEEAAKLTDEQSKAVRAAMEKARAEGKGREEFRQIMESAVTLTDAQKKGRDDQRALREEISKAVEGLLTEEQKTQLKEARERRGRGRGNRPGGSN